MIVKIELGNSNSYEIFIERLKDLYFDRKVVVVTNPTVSSFHLEYLKTKLSARELTICTIADGEEYKNMQTLEMILDSCFEAKLDRKSLLVAFGGGVIGDMTGFAASIYQRGVDFIQIPTTLLSQVDASVGGKTGINNKYGKNLVGTFHQPKAVYIDSAFLKTLPKREFGAGVAEIIKMAVCFNKDFFEWLEKNDLNDEKNIDLSIQKSVQTKAWVVSQDEKEQGLRAALNYGHTFGHVIENLTKYKTYLHGEAVGIGMCMANSLAVKLGIMSKENEQRVKNLLEKYNIPTTFKIDNVEDFYEHFYLDKKSSNSKIKFIVPIEIGDCKITDEIKKEDVIEVLKEFK
ncbi:3-dehydroquinate synthase [Aliarcobacter skirrowii]|uniref:3-dehydroquinate synthase n=1 Tax=Aliarcobacter skirrowii CCUG 10374 TaxID=1032239 RepID=A0AAD0SLX4_9BACT|nr:3-dehydroquinate synthase [Aliarcobacter skirrowii]AXX85010.1 3-dehydroquinate synthase [Aliarcobacter skirrowii CCUG 10374]KAB0620828.1 3-dehydroquinate synthase [Aliarcobacter skirrowii CCUG 10374]RXI25828.1 3-dehydroquinate synthase [Aliarcobacter skirrowii CCUG 10374]SUU96467.1 3-dehydroquinate synthase [Aliarcobacter skirrowii]HAC70738.1 3-dehydroquinate synthase [Aliarcobacter skirrowii]